MGRTISATVVGGAFVPDAPVPLAERTRVTLRVELQPDAIDPAAAWEAIKARLRERPVRGGERFTRDELHDRR